MTRIKDEENRPALRPNRFPARVRYGEEEIAEVTEALHSQVLFGPDGTKARALEHEFARLYGRRYAIACTSGTAAEGSQN